MNEIVKLYLGSLARTTAAIIAGDLLHAGLISQTNMVQAEDIFVGILTGGVALLWSFIQKRRHVAEVQTALMTPPPVAKDANK